jgi:hypothetical protein
MSEGEQALRVVGRRGNAVGEQAVLVPHPPEAG